MSRNLNTHETFEQNLFSLSEETIDDLTLSYAAMDILSFARHLHTLSIDDKIKGELLKAKVSQKPKERDDTMRVCVEQAMNRLWRRIEATV